MQDALTAVLAELLGQRPEWRDLLLLGLAAVGRGGQGDVGQRIRDEILYVQSRNNAKVRILLSALNQGPTPAVFSVNVVSACTMCNSILCSLRSMPDLQSVRTHSSLGVK